MIWNSVSPLGVVTNSIAIPYAHRLNLTFKLRVYDICGVDPSIAERVTQIPEL
jgi:hypothetical protein